MNILYIAYSCDPYNGSEDQIGWNIPAESARQNKVYVITKQEHKTVIEQYLNEHSVEHIRFFFVDIPPIYKKVFKGALYSGRLNVWHRYAFPLAKEICGHHHIDVIHQITPVEFRAIGNYGRIDDAKFVCGPLGGGEYIPYGLRQYAMRNWLPEVIRYCVNHWYRFFIGRKWKQCDCVMFANSETKQFLGKQEAVVTTEIGISDPDIPAKSPAHRESNDLFTLLVPGRLVYRKGHDFLLDALLLLPDTTQYQCRIVGKGPELSRLQARCCKSRKLQEHVVFTGAIPYTEMKREYLAADAVVVPSLRETTGSVLLEAMSVGLPIVTANRFGGSVLLDENTAWMYEGHNKETHLDSLTKALQECIENPNESKRRGYNAGLKAEEFTWAKKVASYQKTYEMILNK